MITEDYVSFEVAKLLKEKGFDEQCMYMYDSQHTLYSTFEQCRQITRNNSDWIHYVGELNIVPIAAPTIQMTMKWLREVHGIFIGVSLCKRYENTMDDDTKIMFFFELLNLKEKYPIDVYSQEYVHTYEEAVEAAIKYCLTNLIK